MPLLAQHITFEKVTPPLGFELASINDLKQDAQGYIWIATTKGLQRYDGYTWKTFLHDSTLTSSLADNKIVSVCPTRDGKVWVGTFGMGMDCLDPESGKVTHHFLAGRKEFNWQENFITYLREDRMGNLWIGTNRGLYCRQIKTGQFTRYVPIAGDSTSLSHLEVQTIYEDREGTLWIGTGYPDTTTPLEGGLNKFDSKTGRFTRYLHNPKDPYSLIDSRAQVLFEDSRGTFWVGTAGDGLHTLDRKTGKFTRYPYQADHPQKLSRPYAKNPWRGIAHGVNLITEDAAGAIWIGAVASGLNRYEPSSGKLTHFEMGAPGDLPDNTFNSALRTRDGLLWMGTTVGQLLKVPSLNNLVTHVATPAGVHIFHEDAAGTMWLGTAAGLRPIEPLQPASQAFLRQAARQTTLLTDRVTRINQDRKGNLWISAWNNGLYHFTTSTGRFHHYKHDSLDTHSLSAGNIVNTYQDHSGTIWVLTEGGLNRLDNTTGRFTHYYHDPNDSSSLASNSTFPALEDRTGAFWVGTVNGGLHLLDRATGKSTNFLPGSSIIQLLEDASGTLWVAAHDRGLYWLNRQKYQFESFVDPVSGKPLPYANSLLEDKSGTLWVGAISGLAAINRQRDSLRLFGSNYGIGGAEDLYFGARYQSRDGSLYYGGESGYYKFRPELLLKHHAVSPQLVLSALRIHNQSITPTPEGPLQEGLSQANIIHLSHNQSVFSIDFVGIDYRHPEQHQYTYMLENYDFTWRPAGSERTAHYFNVPPGEYIFRVKVVNSDGIWTQKAISILISPPWWRTIWAYALYAFAFVGLFYGGWRYLLLRERSKNEQQLRQFKAEQVLEMDQLKSHFFANISHEFRTPLTLILSPLEKKLRTLHVDHPEQSDFQLMHRNALRLLQLVNQLLDLSKLEAGKMVLQTEPGEIIHFFQRIATSFTSLAEARQIQFGVHAPDEYLWVCFDKDKLEKILNNLLSNAFKFTPTAGSISISLRLKPASALDNIPLEKAHILADFSIKDTGIGISSSQIKQIFNRFHQVDNSLTREQEGSGIGLSLTKELVELHGGSISVESELEKGTTFTVSLPLELMHHKQLEQRDVFSKEHQLTFGGITERYKGEELTTLPTYAESSTDLPAPMVLIVEDNADLRRFMHQILREYSDPPYRVIEATNGEEGYHKAMEHIPDLIISDIMMPKMDGIALCSRLKTDEKTSHVPVILLTAKTSGESKVEGLERGADDYLTKPFEMRELLTRIHNLIEGRRKLKAHFSGQVLLQPQDIAITSADERFLKRTMEVIESYMGDTQFNVDILGKEVGMSRTQLYRKLQALTGQSPSDFIKVMRLQRAAQLIAKGSGTVSEISYQVGFSSHSYFSKCFLEQYGQTPSEYQADKASL
ncbi:response regulator [Rhodocytophaga rosea]|uniref:histidine kinase n=1 Tax=Rhodocytophaga rosea TaxID=2704465 RepID=A0A6C0GU01_9BACT|nr:two-component regulator propeller domain-containing protein [Rhodocytophaga rosea]QHT71668.1 response regulator [Rhodocytophaga rosea]